MSTWAEVGKGDTVELRGKRYVVTKLKVKGKRALVAVEYGKDRFESEVKLSDAVTIVKIKPADAEPLYKLSKVDKREVKFESKGLPEGDPSVTKPPTEPGSDLWETQRDKIEGKLERLLGAHLVGEATDEATGYYVPPVGLSTVATHWMIFHEGEDWQDVGEAELMARHTKQHAAAQGGAALKVNHWHTETRPNA